MLRPAPGTLHVLFPLPETLFSFLHLINSYSGFCSQLSFPLPLPGLIQIPLIILIAPWTSPLQCVCHSYSFTHTVSLTTL